MIDTNIYIRLRCGDARLDLIWPPGLWANEEYRILSLSNQLLELPINLEPLHIEAGFGAPDANRRVRSKFRIDPGPHAASDAVTAIRVAVDQARVAWEVVKG